MSLDVDSDNYDLENLNHLTKEVIYLDNNFFLYLHFFSVIITKTSK